MGSTVSITNRTEHKVHICLKQLTPLYFENNVSPGQTFARGVGKVWFTIEVYYGTKENEYDDVRDIVLPIAAISIAPVAGLARSAIQSSGLIPSTYEPLICSPGWCMGSDRHLEIRQRLMGGKTEFYLIDLDE